MIATFAITLGVSIVRKGMPSSQSEWIPPVSVAFLASVMGFSLGTYSYGGIFVTGVLMFYAKKIRSKALTKNKDVIACQNTIARTRQEIADLLSPDLMTAIRRLG